MSLVIPLPEWLDTVNHQSITFSDDVVAMEFVLALARRNVQHDGGPFAAAIVSSSGELIAAGVNRVVSAGSSILHAEMLALMLAQQKTGFHDLSAAGHLTLVTSCAPCAMCLGAIPWSGVSRVVCGARGEDAESIGFDEGDKPARWQQCLQARSIQVSEDVCREQAAALLKSYREDGRPLY
jgi:tRNA(Arg) A34 adenosine deaminase TadA